MVQVKTKDVICKDVKRLAKLLNVSSELILNACKHEKVNTTTGFSNYNKNKIKRWVMIYNTRST